MMGVELDQRYQVEAYNAIQSSIKETGKAGVVLPTGTGKTYLALKLIEDNLDKDKIQIKNMLEKLKKKN